MRITRKLLTGFLLVNVTTLGLGAAAIYSNRVLTDLTTRMYDRALMTSSYAQSARAGFVKLDRARRDPQDRRHPERLRRLEERQRPGLGRRAKARCAGRVRRRSGLRAP